MLKRRTLGDDIVQMNITNVLVNLLHHVTIEILTTVTMKNVVFCDIKTQCYVTLEVFTVVTMKNAVFWDVISCGSCKHRRFGGTYRL
jgi:hypothetical protein